MGGKSAALSLSSSKLLIENALPKLKSAFESKGYEVTHAEPAGVGYYWRGPDDYWVYDFDAKDKSNDKWRVENMEPVFEYQTIKSNHEVSSAVKEEFERSNDSISMNRLSVYFAENRNVSAIANNTGADTVCFARLWGKRYSAGRIAGDVALKVLVAMLGGVTAGGLQEEKTMNIACANVKTKQLLWQNTYTSFEDPIVSVKYKSVTEAGEAIQTVSLADTEEPEVAIGTPLIYSARYGDVDIANILVNNGADISATDESGNTTLHIASQFGRFELVNYLLMRTPDVNALNKSNNTPLHLAVMSGRRMVAEQLVYHGANLTGKNSTGDTPLKCAEKYNKDTIIALLEPITESETKGSETEVEKDEPSILAD
ncbi:MAG: ankyrin repeat domain-containing protein [Candidatus Thiodiazotropha sp. L084R]